VRAAAFAVVMISSTAMAGDAGAWPDLPQWYVSGIVGGSFMTVASGGTNIAGGFENTGSVTDGAFTGGGALGRSLPVDGGRWRVEVEGRGRAALAGTTPSAGDPFFYDVDVTDGWSVTANAWRDITLGDHWAVYVGGGLGGGGYRLTADDLITAGDSRVAEFAWQAGGGAIWRIAPRLELDLGYRFLGLGVGSTPLADTFAGDPTGVYTSSLSASELLLSVRVFEPLACFRASRHSHIPKR
jgi:opacity protein-like surface antigen